MQRLLCSLLLMLAAGCGYAQDPVKWTASVKKAGVKKFEVHLTALIDAGWHIYARQQPNTSINIPTRVRFSKNPLVLLNGPVEELGKKITSRIEALGIEDIHYEGQVDFVQKLSLKGSAKTSIVAFVDFQACTNEKCLPVQTLPLTITLN